MQPLRLQARVFIYGISLLAAACYGAAFWQLGPVDAVQFLCYLTLALVASALKVTLPGIEGTMSVNFLFILLGIMELNYPETLALGCAAVLVQCYWKSTKPMKTVHVVFNLSQLTVATTAAYIVYHAGMGSVLQGRQPIALLCTAVTYFLFNTAAMSVVISLTEQKTVRQVWSDCYFWSFPFYLLGAGIAESVGLMNRHLGWQATLLIMPAVYVIYRSYNLYLGKLRTEKLHVEQMASLHLRTIEALALAIAAKDHTTHSHLERVRVYAMELANDLGLTDSDKEALKAASLLHDIGKLAVPEHIIAKPGRLTAQEFEKMKIHPVVGAEILEQVKFPYPVVPIVRSHHEKWDGTGYPDGLKGEEIPMGARILAAVDCLDALASDRQYRKALPLDDAMAKVIADAGKHFDPRVVQVLQRRYKELEQMAHSTPLPEPAKLSLEVKVERGAAPDAGFAREDGKPERAVAQPEFLSSIAAAREEGQLLFELTHELGSSLELDATLTLPSARLKRLVPFDYAVVYVRRDETLISEFIEGPNRALFSSMRIPVGEGLSGWVADNCKSIVNGNPTVEPGYDGELAKPGCLQSALAVPLIGSCGNVGVISLYRSERDAFTQDDLRILTLISSKLGVAIENALKYKATESSAATDYLTGLPNARSLFLRLDEEIARCKRSAAQLALFVADLDGFKTVNDSFGHLEGNRVLKAFAERLRLECREYDFVARLGGDEFVIIAPGLSAAAAHELKGRVKLAACDAGRAVCGNDVVYVSIGEAFFPSDGESSESLLAIADRRMYEVKQSRNEIAAHAAATGGHAG